MDRSLLLWRSSEVGVTQLGNAFLRAVKRDGRVSPRAILSAETQEKLLHTALLAPAAG